jgi:hypothetical protein
MPDIEPTKTYPTVPNPNVTVSLSERKTRTVINAEYSATCVRKPTAPTPAKSFTNWKTAPDRLA